MIVRVPQTEVVMFLFIGRVVLGGLESAKCRLHDSQEGTDTQGRPYEQLFSLAAPPKAPPAYFPSLELAPFRHSFFNEGGFQILEFITAAQLDKPTDHRFDRLKVIGDFAQQKQIIST